MKGGVLVLGIWLLGSSPADAQTQHTEPSFRAGATRIEVSAVVVDGQGRSVPDLRRDEVQVFEGGLRQEIRTFSHVRLGTSTRGNQAHTPAPVSTGSNGERESSRVVALLIDDLHIDGQRAERARLLAHQVIDQLSPSDLLFVGLTSDPTQSTGVFTTARRRARDLVDRFSGTRLATPSEVLRDTPAFPTQVPRMLGSQLGLSADMQQHGTRLAQAFEAINALAEGLSTAAGRRKTLFLLTEGPAAPVREDQGAGPAATDALRQAVASAARADLAVYPLNPAGLDMPTDGMLEGFTRAVDSTGREVAHEDLSNAIRNFVAGRTLLRDLAALTGGRALTDRNDTSSAIAQTLREAGDYYVISYEPARENRAALVPLEVRVSRPGVRVRTRQGRAGPLNDTGRPSSSAAGTLAQLLRGPSIDDRLSLTLRAFRLADSGRNARYAVSVGVSGRSLVSMLDGDRLTLEQALVTADASGALSEATRRLFEMRLPSAQVNSLESSMLRSVWLVEVPTGLHQVRMAVRQPDRNVAGVAALDLHTADDAASEVDLLSAEMSGPMPTAFVDPTVQEVLSTAHNKPLAPALQEGSASDGRWATAAQAYRRGEYASAAQHASVLDGATLNTEVTREIGRWREEPDRDKAAARLTATAALALELALVHTQDADTARVSQFIRLGEDARDALVRTGGETTFTAQWALGRVQLLLLAGDFKGATKAAADVPVKWLTGNALAEWYVARGLAREAQSRQALWDRPTNTQVAALAPTHFERELWIANERQAAISEYRRALEASPDHLEAHVRLGRVLFENGQTDDARVHLATAASKDCSTTLCGMAWLFLGDWHARRGTAAEASEAYLQASRVLDVRQSALISLLRLTLLESPAAASALLRQFDATSMLGRQQTPDAWSRYLTCSPMGLSGVLGAIREGARR